MAHHRHPDADLLADALTHVYRRLVGRPSRGPSKQAVASAVHDWILAPAAERKTAAKRALAKAAGEVAADVMGSAADSMRRAADGVREAAADGPTAAAPGQPAKRSTRPNKPAPPPKTPAKRSAAAKSARKPGRS